MSTNLAELIQAPDVFRRLCQNGMSWDKFVVLAHQWISAYREDVIIARTDWDDEVVAWRYSWRSVVGVTASRFDTGRSYGCTYDGGSCVFGGRLRRDAAREAATRYVLSMAVRGSLTTGPKSAILTINGDVIERLNDEGVWVRVDKGE